MVQTHSGESTGTSTTSTTSEMQALVTELSERTDEK